MSILEEKINFKGPSTSLKDARIGLISGFLLYGLFGFIDPFMMPINYILAWKIRYFIILPAVLSLFLWSYNKRFINNINENLLFLLIGGILGIVVMIAISDDTEGAYWGYYAGLILIFMWSGFVFKLSINYTLIVFLFVILSYNIVAILVQNILVVDSNKGLTWFLANNFFLISSGFLSVLGSQRLQKSQNRIIEENQKYRVAADKAEESDRLKSAFLANMSHEIRTPLNAILGFSLLLKDDDTDEEEGKQFLDLINNSGNNLLRIINDIIDISKIEAGQLRITKSRFNVNEVINTISQKYQNPNVVERKDAVDLIIHTPEKTRDIQLRTDVQRLEQILDNLIINAFKFTDKGKVELGYNLKAKEGAGFLEFFVKDTGKGIPEDKKGIIFERFRQVEEDVYHEGAGLGLSICKGILLLLDGDIWFNSEEGKGTTFYFTLPL